MTTPALSGFHIARVGSLRGYGHYSSREKFDEGVRQMGGILLSLNHPLVNLVAVKELLGAGGRTKLVSNLINSNPGMLFVDSHDLAMFLNNENAFPNMFTRADGKWRLNKSNSQQSLDLPLRQAESLSDLVTGYRSALAGICI